jgi:ligand-binding sensor domain-containing protein
MGEKIGILFFQMIITVTFLFGQESVWENYTYTKKITDILNDGEYLWIATDGGLYKYNKNTEEFQFYNRANINLPDNHIRSLAKDNNGKLWLTTHYYGIGCFDGQKCTVYNSLNSRLPSDQWNLKIIIDKSGNKWIGSHRYLVKYDGKDWKNWTIDNPYLSYYCINDLEFDINGNLWIGASWGLSKLQGDNLLTFNEVDKEVYDIESDNDGNLWIGSKNGLLCYDGYTFEQQCVLELGLTFPVYCMKFNKKGDLIFTNGAYLMRYDHLKIDTLNEQILEFAYKIEMDNDGVIWLGTFESGLIKYDGISFEKIDLNNSTLSHNNIMDIENSNNSIYVLTGIDNQLMKLTEYNWSIIDSLNGLKTKNINVIESGMSNDLYIGGNKTTLTYYKSDTICQYFEIFKEDNISCILSVNKNIFWIGTFNNGLIKYENGILTNYNTINSNLPSNYINDLSFDINGNLWGSTGRILLEDASLFRFNGTSFEVLNWKNSKIPNYFILNLEFDSKNNLWCNAIDKGNIIGLEWGGGVFKFNGNSWVNYNIINSAIPSNTVFDIFIDSLDNIWLGTFAGGIAKFDGDSKWKVYNVYNSGLAYNDVNKIMVSNDNMLWIGHMNGGISVVDLENLDNITDTVKENDSNIGFTIFPNPANNRINFKLNEDFQGDTYVQIQIFDLLGKQMSLKEIELNNLTKSFDYSLAELNITQSGIFILRLLSNNSLYSYKLIIEK